MRKFIIMGVQGCGKGTQAKLLAETFDLTHICVGDIFRWHLQSHTKLGARIGRFTAAGELVPDDIVEEIVRSRLDGHDWNYGFILDGFPRNRRQAEFFLESYDIDAVIHIDVPDKIVFESGAQSPVALRPLWVGLQPDLSSPPVARSLRIAVRRQQLVAWADDTPEGTEIAAARLSRKDGADSGAVRPQGAGRVGRRRSAHGRKCRSKSATGSA